MATIKKKLATPAVPADAPEGTAAPVKAAEKKPRRIPAPPKIGTRTASTDALIIKTEMIDLSHLQTYHKNPRVGNVDEIAKSLHTNKQFKPIVVNVGTKTGRKYEVLAGNHTFLAAKKEIDWQQDGRHMHKDPWTKIYAAFVDVSDDECKRIVLADNRTQEYGSYDDKLLAQLFAELPDTVGTGYHKDEIDRIISNLPQPEDTDAVMKSLEDFRAAMPSPILGPETDNRVTGSSPSEWGNGEITTRNSEEDDFPSDDDGDFEDDDFDEEEELEIDDVSVQLQATLQLLEGRIPHGINHWNVPELRRDMLMTKDDVANLRTWADKDLTPDDKKTTFFTNFASGARKGLPFDRTVMGFYNEDEAFDKWFYEPAWHVTKFSLLGLNKVVIPDYSLYGDVPRAVHMYQVFKAMWLGRYMQEAGWRVAPRLQFCPTDPDTWEIALLGIPENPPVLFFGAQNFGRMHNLDDPEKEKDLWCEGVSKAIQQINPEVVVAYVGNPGKRIVEQINFGNWAGEIKYIETVSTIRNRKRDENMKRTASRKKKLKAAKERAVAELKAVPVSTDEAPATEEIVSD